MADPRTSDDGRGGEDLNTPQGHPKSTQGDQTRGRPRAIPNTTRPGSDDAKKREINDQNKDLDANNTD